MTGRKSFGSQLLRTPEQAASIETAFIECFAQRGNELLNVRQRAYIPTADAPHAHFTRDARPNPELVDARTDESGAAPRGTPTSSDPQHGGIEMEMKDFFGRVRQLDTALKNAISRQPPGIEPHGDRMITTLGGVVAGVVDVSSKYQPADGEAADRGEAQRGRPRGRGTDSPPAERSTRLAASKAAGRRSFGITQCSRTMSSFIRRQPGNPATNGAGRGRSSRRRSENDRRGSDNSAVAGLRQRARAEGG